MNETIKRVIETKEIDNDAVMSALVNDNKKLTEKVSELTKDRDYYKHMTNQHFHKWDCLKEQVQDLKSIITKLIVLGGIMITFTILAFSYAKF